MDRRNFQVGKWSQGRVGSPFATYRKIAPSSFTEVKPLPEAKALTRDVCALLEEAAFITGGVKLGSKRRRVALNH